jgi:hypothetical protein
VTSSLTAKRGERKEKAAKNLKNKKAKKTYKKAGNKSHRGSSQNPHEIDGGNDDSWQVLMLDIRRGEVKLQQDKLNSQKQQHTMEVQLQQDKWMTEKQQHNLQYKFDLMVKYKKLQEQGFDNHQIVKMIPDMRTILDRANMLVHVQLDQASQEERADQDNN